MRLSLVLLLCSLVVIDCVTTTKKTTVKKTTLKKTTTKKATKPTTPPPFKCYTGRADPYGKKIEGTPMPKLVTCAKGKTCCLSVNTVFENVVTYSCESSCPDFGDEDSTAAFMGKQDGQMTMSTYCRKAVGNCNVPMLFNPVSQVVRMSFEAAAEKVKNLVSSPSNDELLELYALYKQGTVGDNTTAKPGMFDLKGKAKWSSWDSKKGVSQEDAKTQYISLVEKLVEKYKLKE